MQDPMLELPGYALRRAANAMMAELARDLSVAGLRQTDVAALILIDANANITASRLGKALDIQRANMVPLVGRLEEMELIVRAPIDGKSHGLALTPEGKRKLGQARAIIDAFEGRLLARIPPAHRDHLLPALNALWR